MYNPKNVFGMKEVKVHKDKGVYPCKDAPKPDMSGVRLPVSRCVALALRLKVLCVEGRWLKR